jgi:CheY-like chemotaxis protein
VLVVLDDGRERDRLVGIFAERGAAVTPVATLAAARGELEGDRHIDVVVTAWDTTHTVGGELYRWALKHRVDLRGQFVFICDVPAPDFDRVVAGRCLSLRPEETEELVRVVEVAARRHARLADLSDADVAWLDADRPSLLVADDEPELLHVMSQLLGDLGFVVTTADSGRAAIAQLEAADFDAVMVDWFMPDGSGADVYRWVCTDRPWLLERLIVLTGGDSREPIQVAQGCTVMPKGQNSEALINLLVQTARKARAAD